MKKVFLGLMALLTIGATTTEAKDYQIGVRVTAGTLSEDDLDYSLGLGVEVLREINERTLLGYELGAKKYMVDDRDFDDLDVTVGYVGLVGKMYFPNEKTYVRGSVGYQFGDSDMKDSWRTYNGSRWNTHTIDAEVDASSIYGSIEVGHNINDSFALFLGTRASEFEESGKYSINGNSQGTYKDTEIVFDTYLGMSYTF